MSWGWGGEVLESNPKYTWVATCMCDLLPCKVMMLTQCDDMSGKERSYKVHTRRCVSPITHLQGGISFDMLQKIDDLSTLCATLAACSHVDKLATYRVCPNRCRAQI